MKRLFIALSLLTLLFGPVVRAAEVRPGQKEEGTTYSEAVNAVVQDISTLSQLKLELAQAQYRYFLFQSNVKVAAEELTEVQDTEEELTASVEDLEKKIKDSGKQILSVKSQKEENTMDLDALEEDLADLELQFEDQKALVGDLMLLLYLKRDSYFNADESDWVSLLASSKTVSENLQEVSFLDLVEDENRIQMDKMETLSLELEATQDSLFAKQDELDLLDVRLAEEKLTLEEQLVAKNILLEETSDQADLLETMLNSKNEREEDLTGEIDAYQKNIEDLKLAIEEKRGSLSEEEAAVVAKLEKELAEQMDLSSIGDFVDFIWPVSPRAGLTAYFYDTHYQAAFGVPHHAIDIRAKAKTPIHAVAEGIVERVVFRPDSAEYASITLVHANSIHTVYGHVSGVNVQVGDYVKQDDIIGWTGGQPGSVGAGGRTTGPHLHFEMWLDGAPIDPLTQLPLTEVPVDSLPKGYEEQVQKDLEQEINKIEEALGV